MFSKIKVNIIPKFLQNFNLKGKLFRASTTEDLCYNIEVLKKFRVSKILVYYSSIMQTENMRKYYRNIMN
jgi:hypothetical protein